MQLRTFLIVITGVIATQLASAQTEIPLGTWRLHLSYRSINALAESNDRIFAASDGGVLIVDKSDRSIESVNRLNGLSSFGITDIAYSANDDRLLVAYEDGVLDIIGNEVVNFDRLRNSNAINGSKRINRITVNGSIAYISSDFGVVVFDLNINDLRETWRNIGPGGTTLKINDAAIVGDSIFLGTTAGLMAGNLNTNLLDFNLWRRYNTGDISGNVEAVKIFNNTVYAAITGKGLYRKQGNNWAIVAFGGQNASSLDANEQTLTLLVSGNIYQIDGQDQIVSIGKPSSAIHAVIQDVSGNFWVGDAQAGVLTTSNGEFVNVAVNGPNTNDVSRIKYDQGKIYALPGAIDAQVSASVFENGLWSSITSPPAATDYVQLNNSRFFSSATNGLAEVSGDVTTSWNELNSPLEKNLQTSNVNVPAIAASSNGLWITNYGATRPLHLFSNGSFQSFSFPFTGARYPTNVVVDFSGNVWMTLDPLVGGGVLTFNPTNGQSFLKTSALGSGALADNNVNAIAVDRDGYVWVGSDAGVSYFYSPQADVVNPLYENRFLLRGEKITAIEVDPGNRKWVGTEHGVWLFNPTGESMIHNFTEANSPLISNVIEDIEVNDQTGEVFFATEKGMISFRADATQSETGKFNSIKIFPNPVTSQFSGTVGIEGLATDAIVKITDVSGKLIWQTKASGGTATWNVRDYNGRRAETGIYLVFAATADGSESAVGKIAVVE